jgi:hypothetical protein
LLLPAMLGLAPFLKYFLLSSQLSFSTSLSPPKSYSFRPQHNCLIISCLSLFYVAVTKY